MKDIYSSASKITLLLLTLTLCTSIYYQPITFAETFKSVVLVVIGFYFGGKTNQ